VKHLASVRLDYELALAAAAKRAHDKAKAVARRASLATITKERDVALAAAEKAKRHYERELGLRVPCQECLRPTNFEPTAPCGVCGARGGTGYRLLGAQDVARALEPFMDTERLKWSIVEPVAHDAVEASLVHAILAALEVKLS
jgi:hypothetical protein